jgi:hypothetical protein
VVARVSLAESLVLAVIITVVVVAGLIALRGRTGGDG